jgi:hypothetical protein
MAECPDLTAELDAAEDIVMGRAEKVETEWGVRYAPGRVGIVGMGPDNERHARWETESEPGTLVRRTVTYGPWEDVRRT